MRICGNAAMCTASGKEKQLISSVILVCAEPIYTDKEDLYYSQYFDETDTRYVNAYGSRDVGVCAERYDEVFYRVYNPEKVTLTTPLEYMDQVSAQSFLHYGTDPAGLEKRTAENRPVLREVDKAAKKKIHRGIWKIALFSALSYPVIAIAALLLQPHFFNVQRAWVLGVWALFNAFISLITSSSSRTCSSGSP